MPDLKHTTSSHVWRAVNIFMAVFFTLAAYVNINDDDWYVWVPIYAVPALLCVSVVIRPRLADSQSWRTIINLDFAVCLLFGLYQMYALFKIMSSDFKKPLYHEEGREMSGLLIILIWSGITSLLSFGRDKNHVNIQRLATAFLWITTFLAIIPLFMWSLCFISDWHKHFGHSNSMFPK